MAITVFEAARLLWCPGLAQLTGNHQSSIHDWLATATYAPSVAGKALRFVGIDKQRFLEALGSDINRTARAASETLLNIVEIKGLSKSLAWPYVKLYYSSLFYTHALLRIWGRSPSYFRTSELIPLRDLLAVYSVTSPYKIQTGQYLLIADVNASTVEMQSDSGSSGSHESVWRALSKALAELRASISSSHYLTSDKQILDAELNTLMSLISKNGSNTSWPSYMRNEIQYRQAEGVWYPYDGKAKTAALEQETLILLRGEADLSKLTSATGSDLVLFRSACAATICFVRGVIADLSAVGGSKHFLRYGQRELEDAMAARA